MSVKHNSIVALFFILVLILVIKPNFIYRINSSILGRLFLICLLVFFAMYNVTLALLTVFIIIILLNKYDNFVEGMDNIETPDTIGEENVPITGKQQVLTKDAVKKDEIKQNINDRISDLKAKAQQQTISANTTTTASTSDSNMGMDKEDIKNAIQSMPANSIPTDKSMFNSNDNVQPLTASMLTNKSSLTEGFCPCAASVVF
jgi:hypothetical protein